MLTEKACITGASSGIGRELAYLLAEKGVELVLCGRNREALEEIGQEVLFHTASTFITADLATKEGVEVVARNAVSCGLLIISAGIGYYGEFLNLSFEEQQKVIDVNCSSTLFLIHTVAKRWQEEKKVGTVVVISSIIDKWPAPLMSVYAASKAFITSFCQALDYELTPFNIRCLVARPGQVATQFRKRASKGQAPKQKGFFVMSPKRVAKKILWQIAKKRGMQIIDWRYKALCFFSAFMPKKWVMKFLARSVKDFTPPG